MAKGITPFIIDECKLCNNRFSCALARLTKESFLEWYGEAFWSNFSEEYFFKICIDGVFDNNKLSDACKCEYGKLLVDKFRTGELWKKEQLHS